MDTASFVVKRRDLQQLMEAERAGIENEKRDAKPSVAAALLSLGLKWGLFSLAQDWALAGVGHWVSGLIGRRKPH